ncbi:hypothetical protein GCM10025795_44280 [Verticiella sediminum]
MTKHTLMKHTRRVGILVARNQRNLGGVFMHKRIATFCSAALLCAGVGSAAIAHAQPTSSMTESSAPASAQGAGGAPAAAAPAPGAAPGAGAAPGMSAAPGAADGASAAVTDAQLEKFVESAQKVAALSNEYNQRLQQAEGTDNQQQIVAEANDRMASAVEESGLTVEEFNGISQAIEQDPQLHARAQQMLPQQPTMQ